MCHSAHGSVGQWIQLDLGSSRAINAVEVTNRQDCCQDRFGEHKSVSETCESAGEQFRARQQHLLHLLRSDERFLRSDERFL